MKWTQLDPQDGTNCRSCGMTRRGCAAAEPDEIDVQCCDQCQHPQSPAALPDRASDRIEAMAIELRGGEPQP